MNTLECIKESIAEILEEDNGVKMDIMNDSALINDIGLDSLQLINVLLDLEEKLDLCIDYEEIDFNTIVTVQDLAEYLSVEV